MKKENVVVTYNPPSPALPGILFKEENLIDNPPTPLRGTSHARGAEKAAVYAKHLEGRGKQVVPFAPLREKVGEARMRGHRHAFTLIELLVVVLIIGILAAVAVPQYQKAVEKSRATQAIALLKSMIPAMEAYYVSTGSFPSSFEEFDFELPADWTGNEHFTIGNISDSKSNKEWAIGLDSADSRWYAIQIGHWTGAYQGAGFAYYVTSAAYVPAKQFLCVENRQENEWVTPFEKEDGAFCEKLFHGTLIIDTGNQRFYTFQ